jgi:putative NADH-flavin reductase
MRLLVLGATGGTGLELVKQAVGRGHSVTAFVRSPDRLQPFAERIHIEQGHLLDSAQLEHVLEGHDAVVSGFGPRLPVSKNDKHLLEQFARTLTGAMQRSGVRRVVVESVAFLFKDAIMPPAYLLGRLLFPGIVADATAMERIFEESALEWTMIRPPELTNTPFTGKYRVRDRHLPFFGFKISRANVADFMLNAVESRATIGKIIGVAE